MFDTINSAEKDALASQLTPVARAIQVGLLGIFFSGLACAADSTVGKARMPQATLPAIEVEGQSEQETATGPVQGYAAKRSATATKTDTPIVEIPQSISVIGAEEIEARSAGNLMDALDYTAGVARSEGVDRTSDSIIVRGFQLNPQEGSIYRDGTKYSVNPFNGRQEPYGLERIELLKGASSVLHGTASPGGILNTVSKRPTVEPLKELNVGVGSFHRKQVSGDFGGALTEDGTWSYRLTALKRDSNTFVDHVPDDRTYIAPALKWQPSAATSLTLLSEFQRDRTTYVYGLPAEGMLLPNPNGKIPINRSMVEPGFDKFEVTRRSIGYLFEHAINNGLILRNNVRFFGANNTYTAMTEDGFMDDKRTLLRTARNRLDRSQATVMDTSLQYRWSVGSVDNTSVAGFDYTAQRHQDERYRGTADAVDLFAPVYGGAIGDLEPVLWSSKIKSRQLGGYLQNQMKIANKWIVLVGGRYDKVRHDERALFTDEIYADNEKSSAFTGRTGLVYLAENGVAPYASFSQSFQPQAGIDRNKARFKPTRGEQWELGVRYQPNGTKTQIAAAIYDLTRTNSLVTDPQSIDHSVQSGKVRSRGFEIEAKVRPERNTNLVLAYAYTDARTTESSPLTPEEKDKRTGGVPYNQFSLWGDYSFGASGVPGLKAGAGIRYVASTRAVWIDGTVPSFTLLDAMVSYTTGPWRLALNANNLADKKYVASCTYGCFYGSPRTVIANLTYKW